MEKGQTTEEFHFGNLKDDDGQVFDDQFRPNPDPGLPFPDNTGTPVAPIQTVPTRLITGTRILTVPASLSVARPVQLLPRDPNRCDLSLSFTPYETNANLLTLYDTNGAQLGPASGIQLADITVTASGWYDIDAVIQTYGTTASPADDNNIRLVLGSVANIENPIQMYSGTTGSGRIERHWRYYIEAGRSLFLEVINNATGTAIYSGSLQLNRVAEEMTLTTVTPILLASDQASAQMDSASARVDTANLSTPLYLGNHTGELWAAMVPTPDTAFPSVRVSWIATSK